MKVKLASQVLSKSVVNALYVCKYTLKLHEFKDCDSTIRFIRLFNNAFDVLNSRNISSYGKMLCVLQIMVKLRNLLNYF